MVDKRILNFVKSRLPLGLLQNLASGFRAGFSEADRYSRENFRHLGSERPRGQLRHYHINEQLAKHGIAQHTTPKGEVYGLLLLNELSVLSFCVAHNKPIRPAKFRKELAEMNSVLEPITEDLFSQNSEQINNSLHGCFIISSPAPGEKNQATPREITFAIPYTDYKGFHFVISLDALIESYQEPVEEVDESWPVLRDDLIRIEKEDAES